MDCVNRPRLRGLIAEKGFNLTSLAKKTGHSRDTLSRILRGKTPSYRIMKDLALALEMNEEQARTIFFDMDLRAAKGCD